MNADTERLLRFCDREMSAAEAEQFAALVAQDPALRRELEQMRRVGALLRGWSAPVEDAGADLLEPTLARIQKSERLHARVVSFGFGLTLAALLVLRGSSAWSSAPPHVERLGAAHFSLGAAIERVEASDRPARVFLAGRSTTPVVWLDDDAQEERSPEQDPG